ncbi:MAG: aromatic ring-hydroxylating dioxygenase subunit alpha, partial [Candidatus Sericytochromatia bacterium]|nr:aromatic ring-hydroxylating dioxygenase subunit alpha [Candidatus Sericytochromatia bacterium]
TMSTAVYLSAAQFDLETEAIFRRVPLVYGTSAMVAKPGDYLTSDDYGVPVLIIRGRDGILRAFLNACVHRGARLVHDAAGCGLRALACPYHGWTYGDDGRCLNVTQAVGFPETAAADVGLVALPLEERFGLVWVRLTPGSPLDVTAFVGGLAAELADLDLGGQVPFRPCERAFHGNWKSYIEGSLEAYHVPFAHGPAVNAVMTATSLIDAVGPHTRLILARRQIDELAGIAPHRWRIRPYTAIAYVIFPNTVITVQPDHVMWHRICPQRLDAATVTLTLLVPETAQGEAWAAVWTQCREAEAASLDEDLHVAETVFAGMHSGLLPDFVIGRQEAAIRHFHAAIATACAVEPRPGGAS